MQFQCLGNVPAAELREHHHHGPWMGIVYFLCNGFEIQMLLQLRRETNDQPYLPVYEGDRSDHQQQSVPEPEENEDFLIEDVDDQDALDRVLLDVGHLADLERKGEFQWIKMKGIVVD
jgi:hypothetical protein